MKECPKKKKTLKKVDRKKVKKGAKTPGGESKQGKKNGKREASTGGIAPGRRSRDGKR